MDTSPSTLAMTPSPTDTSTRTRLQGPALTAAHLAAGAIILLTLGRLLIGAPGAFRYLSGEGLFATYAPLLARYNISPAGLTLYYLILDALFILLYAGIGLLIFLRRSDDWLALLVAVMLVTWSTSTTLLFNAMPVQSGIMRLLAALVFVVGNVSFVLFIYLVPDGRFVPSWTRWIVLGWAAWMLVNIFGPVIDTSVTDTTLTNVQFAVSLAVYGMAAYIGTRRMRKDVSPQLRQQYKWVVVGLLAALAAFILYYIPRMAFPALSQPTPAWLLFDPAMYFVNHILIGLIPLTIAFSMMRFRLWDVDVYVNRGLVYGGLTAILVVLGVLDLLVVLKITDVLLGRQQSTIAIISIAMVYGASFQPIRKRLQRFIDRRVYGIEIDYRRAQRPAVLPGDSMVGRSFGPYLVTGSIGRGGMAEVFRGEHPTLHRPVAVKVLDTRLAADRDFQVRFEREAQTIAALRHPNIVQIYDFGVEDGTYYMVMEYISGRSLSDVIRSGGALPLNEALAYIGDVASALDYAHEQQIVHRDVKPSNVMLQPITEATAGRSGYRAILTDFGIAKIAGGEAGITKTGVMGTLDYIAPEQIASSKTVDARADLYALGVMSYQMLTGMLPFKGDNPGALLIAHLQQPAPDPRLVNPDISSPIAHAVMQAMAKDAGERFDSAGAFAAALVAPDDEVS